MEAREYANAYLFKPLEIREVPEKDWSSDPSGVTNGVAVLYLTPRDLAKYGYLYLKRGNWNSQQVVSARWVEESTREQAYIGPDNYVGGLDRRFGYMCSIFPDLKYYGYLGMAGQGLFVLPEQNMVIVFTGALPEGKEAVLLRLVNDYIIPAVLSEDPLPDNPQASSRLETFIQAAAGSQQPVPALPQTALEVSGKTYLLDPNPFGWKDMTFDFQPDSDTAVLRMSGSPDLEIGLDQRYRLTETPDSRITRQLECNLLLAAAFAAQQRLPEALALVEASLVLAEPESYIRIFLDVGEPARELLAAYNRSAAPEHKMFAQKILAAFSQPGRPDHQPAGLVEPLSVREIEVLQLVALGKTNQEIARQLIVSPGTVKAHTVSIYRKLDVANRTEAVAQAWQHGILP